MKVIIISVAILAIMNQVCLAQIDFTLNGDNWGEAYESCKNTS